MNLFGKKKAPPPKVTDTISLLRNVQNDLDKREKHIDKLIEQALTNAKAKSKNKDKRGALFELKRKKMFEKELDAIQGKKMNLEQQIMALEQGHSNQQVFSAMSTGAKALQQINHAADIDKIEETMDDITEAMQQADELSNAISAPIGGVIDNDELEGELEELESEMADEALLSLDDVPTRTVSKPAEQQYSMPSVPTKPVKKISPEEEELKMLQDAMGV